MRGSGPPSVNVAGIDSVTGSVVVGAAAAGAAGGAFENVGVVGVPLSGEGRFVDDVCSWLPSGLRRGMVGGGELRRSSATRSARRTNARGKREDDSL